MRRILFFHECFPAGGAERVTADMARYLTKENFEIHLIASFLKNTIDCIHGCEIPSH